MGGCDLGVVKLIFACSISGSSIVSIFPSNFACKLLFYLVNALVFQWEKNMKHTTFIPPKMQLGVRKSREAIGTTSVLKNDNGILFHCATTGHQFNFCFNIPKYWLGRRMIPEGRLLKLSMYNKWKILAMCQYYCGSKNLT